MAIPFVGAAVTAIVDLFETILGIVRGKADDKAHGEGVADQKLADAKATAATQGTIDALDYPTNASVDDSLQPGAKNRY